MRRGGLRSLAALTANRMDSAALEGGTMTPDERLDFEDTMAECLAAQDDYIIERLMVSELLALCHAQQIELGTLRKNYDLARADLARFTSRMVG